MYGALPVPLNQLYGEIRDDHLEVTTRILQYLRCWHREVQIEKPLCQTTEQEERQDQLIARQIEAMKRYYTHYMARDGRILEMMTLNELRRYLLTKTTNNPLINKVCDWLIDVQTDNRLRQESGVEALLMRIVDTMPIPADLERDTVLLAPLPAPASRVIERELVAA